MNVPVSDSLKARRSAEATAISTVLMVVVIMLVTGIIAAVLFVPAAVLTLFFTWVATCMFGGDAWAVWTHAAWGPSVSATIVIVVMLVGLLLEKGLKYGGYFGMEPAAKPRDDVVNEH